jgi:cytochrome c oxidase cbb3-type subunit 3
MVGISLGSIRKFSRWVAGLSVRSRVIGAVAIVAVVLGGVWVVRTSQSQATLLRTDPDVATSSPALMQFALGRGHAVYDHNCAACHGAKGKGNSTRGVPDLTDSDWLYGSGQASDIETVILYGIRAPNPKTWRLADMPAFARRVPYAREPLIQPLTPADIRDVIQFLYFAGGKPAQKDAAARGFKIFTDRGGCYDCHGDGHGDSAIGGPNLVDNVWLYGGSPEQIFTTIARGRAGYCPDWVTRLSAAKIRETALYVYSLSHPSPPPKGQSAL